MHRDTGQEWRSLEYVEEGTAALRARYGVSRKHRGVRGRPTARACQQRSSKRTHASKYHRSRIRAGAHTHLSESPCADGLRVIAADGIHVNHPVLVKSHQGLRHGVCRVRQSTQAQRACECADMMDWYIRHTEVPMRSTPSTSRKAIRERANLISPSQAPGPTCPKLSLAPQEVPSHTLIHPHTHARTHLRFVVGSGPWSCGCGRRRAGRW